MATVTQAQVAKAVGLSRSAVEKVLNPRTTHKFPEETRQKVFEAVNRLGYRPHRSAQLLRTGKSGIIGIIYSAGLYQASAERAYYCVNAVRKAGYHPLAIDVTFFENDTAAAVGAMIDSRVEGLVVLGSLPNFRSVYQQVQKAGIPVTLVSYDKIPGAPQIYADNRKAFFDLTNHVISLGHKNLAFLFNSGKNDKKNFYPSVNDRAKGAHDAIKKWGGKILPTPKDTSYVSGYFITCLIDGWFDLFQPAQKAVEELLNNGYRPDAILCCNDYFALGAITACHRAGLRVPKDIAITGFDNTNLGACLPDAPLTTVAQPSQEMAEKAVELLLAQINSNTSKPLRSPIKIPCRIVIRKSCGTGYKTPGETDFHRRSTIRKESSLPK